MGDFDEGCLAPVWASVDAAFGCKPCAQDPRPLGASPWQGRRGPKAYSDASVWVPPRESQAHESVQSSPKLEHARARRPQTPPLHGHNLPGTRLPMGQASSANMQSAPKVPALPEKLPSGNIKVSPDAFGSQIVLQSRRPLISLPPEAPRPIIRVREEEM
eukprot:Tamp_27388.p1 GENE.Tamp_27388~~Tamp_27388.p1  ORF type:complete len:160 (+),score=6.12 Tamp_27388:85-564(+)